MINVITSKGLSEPGGSASMTIGSHATRDVRASVRTATGPWRFQLHANAFDTDNHRDNFQRQERNVLARATWAEASTLWSLQLGGQSAQGGLPGGITPADFFSNPQKTYKPRDAGQSEKRNVLLSGEMPAGDWRMGLDLSRRMDDTDSSYIADGYSTQSKTRAKRVSARLWKDFGQGEVRQRLLLGADFERWSQNRDLGDTLVEQASDAFYARHELELRPMGLKVSAGLRQTQAARDIRGSAVGSLEADNTSWDFGAAVKSGERGEWFARLGTSFRLPNADEFACYPYPSGPDCPPVTLLKPQTSSDKELGYREQFAQGRWSVRYYRSDLKNEIGYDPNLGNTNFDPTRREGLELEGNTMWGKSVEVGAQFARRSAVFRSGDYVGKTVPMVPTQTLTARIGYRLTENRRLALATQWVSAQRITEDFNNSCAVQIPSYAVTNLRYSEKVQDWTLAASILNLADRQYYNYRTMCSASLKSVYPEAGRTFMLSAQRHF